MAESDAGEPARAFVVELASRIGTISKSNDIQRLRTPPQFSALCYGTGKGCVPSSQMRRFRIIHLARQRAQASIDRWQIPNTEESYWRATMLHDETKLRSKEPNRPCSA